MSNPTVAEYVLRRLADLGISHIFGVPGDYSFGINDAVENVPSLRWVACANELNAAYAADGYARVRGAAILNTTFGVGELSAINGVMGSKAHRLPVFHLVGSPSERIKYQGLATHHNLGDGDFGRFKPISESACCVSAELTPDNAIEETERVIREALRQSMPAFITISELCGRQRVIGVPRMGVPLDQIKRQGSDPEELAAALTEITNRLTEARQPVAVVEALVARYGMAEEAARFISRTNIGFVTTPNGKGTLDESMPQFLGVYTGEGSWPEGVCDRVEAADLVLALGGLANVELNTGAWSTRFDPAKTITINDRWVQAGGKIFTPVAIDDVLRGLVERAQPVPSVPAIQPQPPAMVGSPDERLTSANLYPRLQRMLHAGDSLVIETGTCMFHLAKTLLPRGVESHSQTLWGSIGWGTPAALGVAMAKTSGRTWLVTGDGSHQLTYNEIAVMGRYGIKPVILVLNNGIYGVEYVVAEPVDHPHDYNNLANVQYHLIPAAMGCRGWLARRVGTVAELEEAFAAISGHDGGVYLEVMIPPEESQPEPAAYFNRQYKLSTPEPA